MDGPSTWRWNGEPTRPGPCVLVDIDGTIADAVARQHFLDPPKRWREFFDAAGGDDLIEEIGRLVDLLAPELSVVLLTARPVRIRELTVDWLEANRVRWDLLVMRSARDFAPSPDVKRAEVRALRDAGFTPLLALDDDPRNVEMFRHEGIPCVELRSGYHDPPPSDSTL